MGKKKLNKKKRRINFKNVLIILGLLLFFYGTFSYFSNLNIKTITILGTIDISDVDVINAAEIKNYPIIYKLNLEEVENKIKSIDLVNDVKVKRNIFGELIIEIDEANELFYLLSNEQTILDNNKLINRTHIGIPTIVNYVPDKILDDLVNKSKELDEDVLVHINEIEYSPARSLDGEIIDDTRFILKMIDGNIVHMNTINIEKLNNYFAIYEEIETAMPGEKGTLKLDSSTDAYIFEVFGSDEDELSE